MVGFFETKMPLRTAEIFCGRMATGLRAGVDILRLLASEAKTGSARHQQAIADLRDGLTKGGSLAEAMQTRSDYFPPLLAQLVTAGEHAGGLDKTFAYMSNYYRNLRETRSSFLKQLIKPAIQLVMAIGVVSLVILLLGMLYSNNDYDPLGFGLRGGKGVAIFLGYVALFFGAIGLLVVAIWKNWFGLHRVLMPLAINVPVVGPVFRNLALSRLTTILSLLLNAGVDAIRSVKTAFDSTGNDYYISASPSAISAVKKGQSLADSFAAARVLPRDFIEAVEVGELSGSETESLDVLAREYDERAKTALSVLSAVASTIVWLAIAGFIIFLIFRFFLNYLNILTGMMP